MPPRPFYARTTQWGLREYFSGLSISCFFLGWPLQLSSTEMPNTRCCDYRNIRVLPYEQNL